MNKKYYVIPKAEFKAEVDAINKEDAIETFAAIMNTDMNNYFMVVTKEEYEKYKKEQVADAQRMYIKSWMVCELVETFKVEEEVAKNLADEAYEIYLTGDGWTEYEAITEAFNRFNEMPPEQIERASQLYIGNGHYVYTGKFEDGRYFVSNPFDVDDIDSPSAIKYVELVGKNPYIGYYDIDFDICKDSSLALYEGEEAMEIISRLKALLKDVEVKANSSEIVSKMRKITRTWDDLRNILDDADLKKAGLSLSDYRECQRLMALLGAPGNIECTICEKAAAFFEKHGYMVFDENGIGYRITI